MTRRFYSIILLLAAMFAVVSCTSHLTSDKFSHIKSGMTSTEVKAILGNPTETESEATMGISGTTYVYRQGQSEVKVVFFNDKVTAIQSHLQ